MNAPAPTAIDLFAGGGGSSTGLTQAGFHVQVAANHDPVAVATHNANHPDTEHRIADLSEVDWRTFPSTTLLWASPSCVWHARAGGRRQPPADVERLRTDQGSIDRATAYAVIAAAEVHRFPAVIVENVPEFRDWSLYRWWLSGLHALGYTTSENVLDAADYGHAQHRRRLFIVATRDGLHVNLTTPIPNRVPASMILDPDPGRPVSRQLYVAHQLDSIKVENVPHLLTYRRHSRALRADQHPLATVTAGGNHHAVGVVRDGVQYHRMLTNRECALAQGFPTDYTFVGTAAQVKKQIGNAVPVGVARWLGSRVAAAVSNTAA